MLFFLRPARAFSPNTPLRAPDEVKNRPGTLRHVCAGQNNYPSSIFSWTNTPHSDSIDTVNFVLLFNNVSIFKGRCGRQFKYVDCWRTCLIKTVTFSTWRGTKLVTCHKWLGLFLWQQSLVTQASSWFLPMYPWIKLAEAVWTRDTPIESQVFIYNLLHSNTTCDGETGAYVLPR